MIKSYAPKKQASLGSGGMAAQTVVMTRVSELSNDKGYFAKKSDIPTVPTNVSAFVNDAGYMTNGEYYPN